MTRAIQSGLRPKIRILPIPITYYEASMLWIESRQCGAAGPFSFVHRDPIDGKAEGRVTMLEPAHFIPAPLWDTYKICAACGEFDNNTIHICPERN